MDLLSRVRARQLELGYSDAQFAARLKVSKACWIRTRERDLAIGWAVACGIIQCRELGDLQADVLLYMRDWQSTRRPRGSKRAA